MKKIQEKGSVLTLVIIGTFLFFGALGAVLFYLFSFAPEQKRQEALKEIEVVRAEEAEKGEIATPLGGDMSVCTMLEGEVKIRYYDDGIRMRLLEHTKTEERISIWDGQLLARFDANGSKKWFKVSDVGVEEFQKTMETIKADSSFECIKKPFSAIYFKRVDDPFLLEE